MPFKPGALTTGFFSLGLKVQNFGFGKIGRPANLPATKRRGGSMDGIDPMLALIARNHDSLRLARETRERALAQRIHRAGLHDGWSDGRVYP
jgi:hypothetical protein